MGEKWVSNFPIYFPYITLHKWTSKPAPFVWAAYLASTPPPMIRWCLGFLMWLNSGLIETSFIGCSCLKTLIIYKVSGLTTLHPSLAAVASTEKSWLNEIDLILISGWILAFFKSLPYSLKCKTSPVWVPIKIDSLSTYHLAFSEMNLASSALTENEFNIKLLLISASFISLF